MKIAERVGTRLVGLGTGMALVLGAAALSSAAEHQGYGKVRFVVGNPTVSKAGGVTQPVERYMILHPGDVVKTDDKSHVDIMLGQNNGSFQVTPSSEVGLDKLTYESTGLEIKHDTQLSVRAGAIAGLVNKMSAASKYDVKTTRGVAAIRGTVYEVAANGNVGVTDGQAKEALSMADGSTKVFTIGAGQMLEATGPTVHPLTAAEKSRIKQTVLDALTHGGAGPGHGFLDLDPESRKFFFESQQEPYISPIAPQE